MKTAKRVRGSAKTSRVSELVRLLSQLQEMHTELLALIDSKISAMKAADLDAMRECNDKEQVLAAQLNERQGLRYQLMEEVGKQIGVAPEVARTMTVAQLSTRVPASQRKRLLDAGAGLRQAIAQVAQANRVAGVVSRDIVNHLRWVFAAVRPKGDDAVDYGHGGVLVARSATCLFDAVG
jgi:hypothetical protein